MKRFLRPGRLVATLAPVLLLVPCVEPGASPDSEALARRLAIRLERGPAESAAGVQDPLASLDRYPLTATTSYLLLGDDPNRLRSLYPRIQTAVTDLFAPGKTTGAGLIAGGADASLGGGDILSPDLNALANIELWSLHLIAWKIGAYEDALEYLAWSRRLSNAITQGFYVPERERFYPADPSGHPMALETPGGLLPLVLDENLGDAARERIVTSFVNGIGERKRAATAPFDAGGIWLDYRARPVVLDLLTGIPEEGLRVAAAAAAAMPRESAMPDAASPPWIDFWRQDPARRAGLFPAWRTYSALVNLTLLLEARSLALEPELHALRGGLDSLGRALAGDSLSLHAFRASVGTANGLMKRLETFAALVAAPKERWKVADESKWVRLSPRTKRLVGEGSAAAVEELLRVKTLLTRRLEKGAGMSFELSMPSEPVSKGEPFEFTALVVSAREPVTVSHAFLHIGENRWAVVERGASTVIAPGSPLRFSGSMALAPGADLGIHRLEASFDALAGAGRIELRRGESVMLAPPYRASIAFPAGTIVGHEPLPADIALRHRLDHDVQGTVDGTILREFTTTPPLPARFLASAASDRTDLSLTIAPKGRLAPGRYPFSLTVSLEGKPIAIFEQTLIRPIRWLHLGPMSDAERALRSAVDYQANLFKQYTIDGESGRRWREAPAYAFDEGGAVCPERLYGSDVRCCLLYTAIDAPARIKVRWMLETSGTAALWLNGVSVAIEPPGEGAALSGALEFRKGPNAILVAACWNEAPDCVRFELSDENGLPVANLGNDLEAIIDGYERLSGAPDPDARGAPPGDALRQILFALAYEGASEVAVIGSFNNWDPAATPMKRDAAGIWRASVMLKPGRHPYKFIVNRKTKIVDPANTLTEPDGFGAFNSILEVK